MSTNTKPPSTKNILFRTSDGKLHNGFFLKDANRYVRGVNRWKDTDLDAWFDDDVVTAWGYEPEQLDGQINMFEVDEAVVEEVAKEIE
jgi:hypothetical protein